jgi:VWFA-related protein
MAALRPKLIRFRERGGFMRLLGALLLHAALASFVIAQNNSSDSSPSATTIRSNPRLVLLNVVVTDAKGAPVHGLNQHDFSVFEDGKAQSIRSFEEHSHAPATDKQKPIPPPLNLGPNVHTNWVPFPKDNVTNILLLDVLNMSSQDLLHAKDELLKTVQRLPAGQQFALFILGTELHMVQALTSDRKAMLAAAGQVSGNADPVYVDARTFSTQIGELRETMLLKNPTVFRNLVTTLATEQDIKLQSRTQYTYDGLSQLARALIAIPGRKNLIWITSGFPFDSTRGDGEALTHLSVQLAASQIAVYPLDARGVMSGQPDAATRDSEIFGTGLSVGFLNGLSEEMRSTYETMFSIAAQTGGRAFLNQNEFLPAISRIVEGGANYYVISYRPTNSKWDGKFRKLQVKSSQRDIRLLYRTGYYAVEDPLLLPHKEDRDRALLVAMQPTEPPSTSLIIKTRVIPPEKGSSSVALDFLVDVADLSLIPTPSEKTKKDMEVIFVANAIDPQGHIADTHSWTVKLSVTEADIQAMRRTGLHLHQDVPFKPGSYQLRLGVLDRNSGKVGTLDVPVTVAAAAPAK